MIVDRPTTLSDLLPQRVELPEISADAAADGRNLDVALAAVPAKPAVYVLLDHNQQPILLACTANLRLGLRRRCSMPSAHEANLRRTNYRQITRFVEYRRVSSTFAANLWYLRAARRLYPDRYRKMLAWKAAWCVTVELEAEFPQLLAMPVAGESIGQWLGPFPDSASARMAIHVLEDVFDLCRYYDILKTAPHGKPCAYKQMGKCPAPCDGSSIMAQYRQSVRLAVEFLAGRQADSGEMVTVGTIRESWQQDQQLQMRSAAARLDFLSAARIKSRIDSTAQLSGERFAYVHRWSRLKFLILQPGATASWVEPFFFQDMRIIAGEPVPKKKVNDVLTQWCNHINAPLPSGDGLKDDPADVVSLLCYHLFRSRDAGLYIAADPPLQVPVLEQQLNHWWTQKQLPSDNMEQASDSAMALDSGPTTVRSQLPMDSDG